MKLLDDKTILINKYIQFNINLLKIILKSPIKLMKHLLVIQGINSDTKPGEMLRKQLMDLFDIKHNETFDPDFDFSKYQSQSLNMRRPEPKEQRPSFKHAYSNPPVSDKENPRIIDLSDKSDGSLKDLKAKYPLNRNRRSAGGKGMQKNKSRSNKKVNKK
jgi:hypothetical protein